MATPYFEETQRLRDNRWIIVLILAVALCALIPLLYGLYWQVGKGVPWGNEPMTDYGLITLTIFVLICLGIMTFVLLTLKLETRIDELGIHYRMIPLKWRWRLVRPAEIDEYAFEKRFKPFESGGIGHHRNVLKNMRSFRISGGHHIVVRFRDGFRLLIGTQDPGSMEWAMRKLMTKTKV